MYTSQMSLDPKIVHLFARASLPMTASGRLVGMLSCDHNLSPLKFITTRPFVNKFEDITILFSKISMLRRIQVKEMKMESSERKHFKIA